MTATVVGMTRLGAGVALFMLLPPFLLAGCRDRSLDQAQRETKEAQTAIEQLKHRLNTAMNEIATTKAELTAVRQSRDELQKQVDKLIQERDQAATFAQTAQEAITHLTTQASGQSSTTAVLEKQIAELKTLVEQQQALIEQLQKGMAVERAPTPPAQTPDSQSAPEPNDKP